MEEQKKEFNQTKYINDFKKKKYDRIEILVEKGKKEEIKELATAAGQSTSEYIVQAIKQRREQESRI